MKKLLLAFLLMFASKLLAGWSSSGGELTTDEHNPWFVYNTKVVKYCILVDEKNFGQKKGVIRKRIVDAIAYWKREFKLGSANEDKFKLATQSFVESKCDKADIKFQFGHLSKKQKKFLRNPRRLVGVTVRTKYDRKTLKGAGFVYISPSFGKLAMDDVGRVKNPWGLADGRLLTWVLMHELGHVFGIQHDSEGDSMVMDSGFSKRVISKKYSHYYTKLIKFSRRPSIPRFPGVYEQCYVVYSESLREFFELKDKFECVLIKDGPKELSVWVRKTLKGKPIKVGEYWRPGGSSWETHKSIMMFLTDEQKVFSKPSGNIRLYWRGYVEYSGVFVLNSGKWRPVTIKTEIRDATIYFPAKNQMLKIAPNVR